MTTTVDREASAAPRWAIALAVALPAALYLATLYPGIGDRAASGDAVEFQFVGRVLGVPHEPGYPQYVLLSFLWSWLPLPFTLATRINLLSAVFAVAGGGFFFAAARSLSGRIAAAVITTWALLTAPDLWRLATQAEVYTLHFLWVAVFFWAVLRWRRDGTRRRLILLLFVYALAFGNHLTMIVLLPALIVALLTRQPGLVADRSAWRWAGIAALVGVAQYLLLVLRSYFPHPSLLERFPLRASPGELLAYVTGDRFVDKHWLPGGSGEWASRVLEAMTHGVEQLTPGFALLALFGVVTGWRRDPSRTLFLLFAAGSVIFFAAAYDIRDWLLYLIPAWVAVALLAADGIARLLERLPRAGAAVAVLLCLALVPRGIAGVERLRITDNPADLASVLAALPPDSRVIPAGGHRLARLHENYYRYGARVETAHGLRFLAARQDVLHKGLHLRRRPFFFRSPTVRKILGGRLIDYRVWTEGRVEGEPLLVTGTDDPLSEVSVRALPGHELELTVRRERRTLTDERDLYVFFVAARDGRAKGLEGLSLDEKGATERLELLLETLPEGDFVLLLVPRLRPRTIAVLDDVLAAAASESAGAADQGLVAAWRRGGDPARALLWRDPSPEVRWTLELAEF